MLAYIIAKRTMCAIQRSPQVSAAPPAAAARKHTHMTTPSRTRSKLTHQAVHVDVKTMLVQEEVAVAVAVVVAVAVAAMPRHLTRVTLTLYLQTLPLIQPAGVSTLMCHSQASTW